MAAEIITKEDLAIFRQELLTDIAKLLQGKQEQPSGQWLRSSQVRKALGGISPGTLQNLRVNGTLGYTKIGGILYYKSEDIQRLLEGKEKPWRG